MPEGGAGTEVYTTMDLSTVNREDLLDVMNMISPVETPFFSTVAKGKCRATLHEWPHDELAAAVNNNAHREGRAAQFDAGDVLDRDRFSNRTQIFTNPFAISSTQEAVETAGIKSEKAYQAAKKMKEHKRDIEASTLRDATASVAGVVDTTARQQAPIKGFISGSNANGVPAAPDHIIAPAAGANGALTEEDINLAMETVWTEGGVPDTILCSARIKRRITGFSLVAHTQLNVNTGSGTTAVVDESRQDLRSLTMDDRRLMKRIDVYEGDFGTVRIIPDRYIPTNTGDGGSTDVYILEMGRWGFDFLISPFMEDLAKVGDSHRSWVFSQGCVVGKTPKANFVYETTDNEI